MSNLEHWTQKKKLLKSNDFILVAIFMAPNFGAQSEKK